MSESKVSSQFGKKSLKQSCLVIDHVTCMVHKLFSLLPDLFGSAPHRHMMLTALDYLQYDVWMQYTMMARAVVFDSFISRCYSVLLVVSKCVG